MDLSDLKLNPREFKFVAAYCSNGFNAVQAFKAAGYHSRNNTTTVLNRPSIQEAIRRFLDIVIEPYKEKLEYLLVDVYYKRAFYTIDIFYDKEGKLLPLKKIPREWLVVIDGYEEKSTGSNQVAVGRYKLANRDEALKSLWVMVSVYKGVGDQGTELPSESRKKLQKIFDKKFEIVRTKGA